MTTPRLNPIEAHLAALCGRDPGAPETSDWVGHVRRSLAREAVRSRWVRAFHIQAAFRALGFRPPAVKAWL